MKTIQEVRRLNARKLRDGVGGNIHFANMIDREPTQTSRFMDDGATKNIGDVMTRHVEKCFDLPMGWLDQEHRTTNVAKSPDVSDTNRNFVMVSVISRVQAEAWTEFDYAEVDLNSTGNYPYPVSCGPVIYILRVIGDSMIDEYRLGDMILVDPEAPAVHGDDVIALMHDPGETTFRRLIENAGQRYLKALNTNWSEPYIKVNSNRSIIGTVIFSGKPRK